MDPIDFLKDNIDLVVLVSDCHFPTLSLPNHVAPFTSSMQSFGV